jgi:hypothetical protein
MSMIDRLILSGRLPASLHSRVWGRLAIPRLGVRMVEAAPAKCAT